MRYKGVVWVPFSYFYSGEEPLQECLQARVEFEFLLCHGEIFDRVNAFVGGETGVDPKGEFDFVVGVVEDVGEGDVEEAEAHGKIFSLLDESL